MIDPILAQTAARLARDIDAAEEARWWARPLVWRLAPPRIFAAR